MSSSLRTGRAASASAKNEARRYSFWATHGCPTIMTFSGSTMGPHRRSERCSTQ